MKRFLVLGIAAVVVACTENPTQPEKALPKLPSLTVLTPPGADQLVCFSGTTDGGFGGTCTTSADHKKGFLSNNTASPAVADYSGVYSFDETVYGQRLTDITALSYQYKSTTTPAQIPTLGDLSYNIPIDANGDGVFDPPPGGSLPNRDFYAFVDAANCGLKSGATVNIVTMAKCGIVDGSPPLTAGPPFVNWAAFIGAYPHAKIAPFDQGVIFIIAERTTSEPAAKWTISNVMFGKTGLICFDGHSDGGFGGHCTLGADFKSATLDNTETPPPTDYAGFYSRETTGYGLFLSNIHDLTYKYKGPVPTLGGLSYNIPIDADGGGAFNPPAPSVPGSDFVAFVDAVNCRGTPNAAGVYTVNITKDPACGIVDGSAPLHPTPFANWAAFAAAYPSARTIASMFIIAERTTSDPSALWTVTNIDWGKPGK
jgi:hypothetical protein